MQLGVSSYSFSKAVSSGALSFFEIVAKTKEMGFDTLEFSTISVPDGATLPDFAKQLRDEADRVDLPLSNYTIGADFLNGSDGDLQAEIERVKGEVDIAAVLGVPGMRHDATRGFTADKPGAKDFSAALPRLVEGCKAITEYAAGKGIKTMVENHGFFCQDSERVERLICGVDHPNFGVLADMGNFLCADEDPAQALGRLMPYASHVHAKDFHVKSGSGANPGRGWMQSRAGNWLRGSIIGHGDVPLVQCIRVMTKAGYDGVLSIEFEGMEDPLLGLEIGLENLRRFVAEAS